MPTTDILTIDIKEEIFDISIDGNGGSNITSVDWSAITNKPSSSVSDIDDAVAESHTHLNITALDLVIGTNTGDQTATTVLNTSDIPAVTVEDALDYIYDNMQFDKTVILTKTVFLNHGSQKVIKLNRFIYWNSNFVKAYKYVGLVRTSIDFADLLPYDTYDMFRIRFKNDLPDATTSDMITEIGFAPHAGVSVGSVIEVEYTETEQHLTQQMTLIYRGWDFTNNIGYAPKPTLNFPTSPLNSYSTVIPRKTTIDGFMWNILYFSPFVISNYNLPAYIEANIQRVYDSFISKVHYLIPNLVYSPELQFNLSLGNLRIEAYELPRKAHKQPSHYYRFLGYYTNNKMRITNLIFNSVGQRRKYYKIGFKIRDISRNWVSDWLPLEIIINRRFRVISGTTFSPFVRFKTY